VLNWFDPGKYAAFVAVAYGVSAIVLAAMVLETLVRARYWRKAAERARPAKVQTQPRAKPKAKTEAGAT